jgi:ubiquinone biosynthesis protein Coq4
MQLLENNKLDQISDIEDQRQHHFQMLMIFKACFSMMTGDYSLEVVDLLDEALLATPSFALAAEYLKKDPGCAQLIQERYIPPAYDLDELLTYPQESLGYAFAKLMRDKGFNPNLHADMTDDTDARYVELRLSQTHDIWHVVTGFGSSPIDEIGLQSFHLPQFPYPLATMLLANSLISSTLLTPEELPQLLNAISKGFHMGKQARPLFAQKWEEGWHKPLSQWREELNIFC